ncbi:MAG TPA: 6-hydroxymethylpterin diphosphokinase MptE-like protein [Methanocorpusculum sp.]|nr:6-hydroxymethylpterin diphosphokinase MptE-like protein [Methanocorpusculum sp.]
MRSEDWEPLYLRILAYFGFSREDDERSAELLSTLLPRDDIALLQNAISGKDCVVCGNAPSLPSDIKNTNLAGKIIIAADAAASVLFSEGIRPDIILSDMDGMDDDFLEMNDAGTILVLHAHGDNIPQVRSWVPKVRGPIVGTTQSTPLANVYNFGGFSDGDRCVFTAHELGAASVSLIGFDLDDKNVDPIKHGKLMIARKLLKMVCHDV